MLFSPNQNVGMTMVVEPLTLFGQDFYIERIRNFSITIDLFTRITLLLEMTYTFTINHIYVISISLKPYLNFVTSYEDLMSARYRSS